MMELVNKIYVMVVKEDILERALGKDIGTTFKK